MSASWLNNALAQLEEHINNCEQAVIKHIEEKKRMSDKSVPVNSMNRKLQHNPIAIVGMASLLPQSRNMREYWENIIKKIDCITDIPDSHWNVDEYYDPNPRTPEDKTYCKRGGFIPYVDFNPMEFGLPPNVLEVTDVSQLLSLVVAKEAMEDAGYGQNNDFNRENVGVVLGVASGKQLAMPLAARLEYPVWEKVLRTSGLSEEDTQKIIAKFKTAYVKWDENAFPGMLANVVAGRIANRLNFGSTNCVVDAACASSLAALKMAISELLEQRADMMLTGGVDTDNSIMAYISFSKTPAVTPGDNVKPFDAKSDGMMLGEGIGMIVLKRLADAERDGDKIYAVIKGIGTSSDGRYKSIYAPRQEGQVKALQRAYEDAGFSPATVGLVEAHGTGTMAGDPTEFASLREYFSVDNPRKQYIALGSVKSQIGHTKAAAGAASLIKTALALHHKVLPPTINVTEPNPKLNIKNSAFYINTETRPWIRAEGEAPRRAGISSFGFGGTNYHVVLEEYTQETGKNSYRINNAPFEVLLSALNPSLLLTRCQEVLANLQSDVAEKQYVELVEESKAKEIPLNAARVGFVVESPQEAIKFLKMTVDLLQKQPNSPAWEHPQGIFYRQSGLELGGKVVSLFSGQGSQYLEMGRELVMNFPVLRNLYGYMDSLLLKDNMQPLSEIVFPHPVFEDAEKNAQIAALQRTEYAQPAIGMLSAGMYKILQQAGFKSDFVAGHSFGELTALWAAGVFNDEDYCKLVKARGQAMAPPQDPDYDAGAMLAVKEDLHKVEIVLRHFPRVMIANYNTPKQVVLAGPTAEINRAKQALQDQSYSAVLLPVSAAFHTPLIAFAQKSFAIALKSVQFQTPKLPVYSNTTGNQYANEPQTIQHILESHLSNSVLFKQEIEHIYAAGGSCFVEFGPRKILSNLVKEILGERPHLTIALNSNSQKNSDRTLREAVVQLRVAGMNLQNLDPFQQPLTVPAATAGSKTLTIKLNGANFVSEKTRKGWEETLKGEDKVQLSIPSDTLVSSTKEIQPVISAKELETVINSPVSTNGHHLPATSNGKQPKSSIPQPDSTVSKVICSEVSQNENLLGNSVVNPQYSELPQLTSSTNQPVRESKMQTIPNNPGDYQQILGSLEYVLTQFQQNQTENLQVHGLYLNNQKEYAQTFFQLMQQQNGLFAKNGNSDVKPVVMESLERSMMQFHSQQGETLRIHEQYLQNQIEYTQSFLKLIQQEYKQLIAGEVTVSSTILTESKSTPVFASVPTPTQIQPVVESVPTPTQIQPVVESVPTPTQVTPVAETTPAPTQIQPVESVPTPTQIQPVVESVPTPTQIKPVESVSAPTQIKPVESVSAPTQIQPVVESVPTPTQIQPVVESVPAPTQIQPVVANIPTVTIDLSDLGDRLLAITSEKTGYPVEMLEMDMDMEADLGIDSIKRVEILGGLQEIYPNLPEPNLEDLAELRTIGQIVEYLQTNNAPAALPTSTPAPVEIAISAVQKATDIPIPELEITPTIQVLTPDNTPTPVVSTTPTVSSTVSSDFANLDKSLLEITSEKTGYPVEMLELDMDMEADLGIDSIKRVEILGALQEAYPDLPKPDNMEELAELRTIGQIVTYLQNLAGGEKKKPESDSLEVESREQGAGGEEAGGRGTRSREQGAEELLSVEEVSHTEFTSTHTPVECNIKRLPARLLELGKPDFLDFTLPEGYVAIVTDDGTLTTTSVVQSLCDRGWKVVVLNFPASLVPEKSPLPQGVNRVALNDLSEEHLQQQLSAIADYFGTVAAFIHLHPHFPNNSPGILYHPDEKAIVKHVFFIAKYLKKPLVEAANHTRSCFLTVAHLDGSFGLKHQNNFGAIGAGLFGLTKTMLWEWANVYCRAVDLSPELTSNEAANSIIAEIHDANRYLIEVGYSKQGRVTLIAD